MSRSLGLLSTTWELHRSVRGSFPAEKVSRSHDKVTKGEIRKRERDIYCASGALQDCERMSVTQSWGDRGHKLLLDRIGREGEAIRSPIVVLHVAWEKKRKKERRKTGRMAEIVVTGWGEMKGKSPEGPMNSDIMNQAKSSFCVRSNNIPFLPPELQTFFISVIPLLFSSVCFLKVMGDKFFFVSLSLWLSERKGRRKGRRKERGKERERGGKRRKGYCLLGLTSKKILQLFMDVVFPKIFCSNL